MSVRPISRDLIFRDPEEGTRWWCDRCNQQTEAWHQQSCPLKEVQP